MKWLPLLGLGIAGMLLSVAAVAAADEATVWQIEISPEQVAQLQPAPPDSWWGRVRHYLSARTVRPEPGTVFTVTSTAYASSPYQTDSTPCITAAGTRVREGVVASNFLPLGTIIEINGKRYIVEDRMNRRYTNRVDVWLPSTQEALEFGRQQLKIKVIEYGTPGQALTQNSMTETTPSVFKRTSLRFLAIANSITKLLPADVSSSVNRYDVNCFEDEPEEN